MEDKIDYQYTHDGLTDLGNRFLPEQVEALNNESLNKELISVQRHFDEVNRIIKSI